MKYRKDIDGLRSLAIIPVVLYHVYLSKYIKGGFVGVDIFFVISGYLISNIIHTEVHERRFSIYEFYRRRVLRIFPAIYAVYIFCLIAGFFILFPSEQYNLGKTVIGSIFFVSNIFFYKTSDYFDESSHSNPLLHTWSLSVEEQFYILFPIIIILISRFNLRIKLGILAAIAILSLAFAEFVVHINPPEAFYLVQFRAWELMIGGLLAIASPPLPKQKTVTEAIGIAGLLLIVGSVFLITENMSFPGLTALPPCLGAAALIYSGRNGDTFAARLLSMRIPRFFGLISYSLYVWHWPIFVFAQQITSLNLPKAAMLVIILTLSVVVATLSWRFIERPFRDMKNIPTGKILASGVAAMALTVVLALLTPFVSQLSAGPRINEAEKFLTYTTYGTDHPEIMRAGTCFLTFKFNDISFFQKPTCLAIDPGKPNYLVVGDSHAAHLIEGLKSQIPDVNFMQATASGCFPVLHPHGEARCVDLMKYIFNDYLPSHTVDGIILSGRWKPEDVNSVFETAAALTKYTRSKVIISGPVTEYTTALPRLIAIAVRDGENVDNFAVQNESSSPLEVEAMFKKHALPDRTVYFSMQKALSSAACHDVIIDNEPRQFDYGHLTKAGSDCVADQMRPLLK